MPDSIPNAARRAGAHSASQSWPPTRAFALGPLLLLLLLLASCRGGPDQGVVNAVADAGAGANADGAVADGFGASDGAQGSAGSDAGHRGRRGWDSAGSASDGSAAGDAGSGGDGTCTPGQAKCKGATLSICADNGQSWATVVCKTNKACQAASCDAALGACAVTTVSCDDGNACTTDTCTEPTGCSHAQTAGVCDDGDPCTLVGVCKGGACSAGGSVDCDDSQACTADSCDAKVGCVHKPASDGAACEDGDPCTKSDTCAAGICVAGQPTGWQMLVGGTAVDSFTAVAVAGDGSAYLGGESKSIDLPGKPAAAGKNDAWFARVDAKGALLWSKLWGGSDDDRVTALTIHPGGGAIYAVRTLSSTLPGGLVGGGGSDTVLLKVDPKGNATALLHLNGNKADIVTGLARLANGTVLVGGWTQSSNKRPGGTKKVGVGDTFLLATSAQGTPTWGHAWGLAGATFELAAMDTRPGGGVVLAVNANHQAYTLPIPKKKPGTFSGDDGALFVTDAAGKLLRNIRLGGNGPDELYGVAARSSDTVVVGSSLSTNIPGTSINGATDLYLASVDDQGQVLWQRLMGGSGKDYGHAVIALGDGSLAVAATSSSAVFGGISGYGSYDGWLLRMSAKGQPQSVHHYGGTHWDAAYALAKAPGGWLIAGRSHSTDNPVGPVKIGPTFSSDGWLIRTNAKDEATCAKKP